MQFFSRKTATVAVLSSALLAGACTDLEEDSFDEIPAADFGQTDEQFIAVLGAAYTSLYGLLGNHNSYWSLQEVSSDEAVIPTRGADWDDGGQWTRVHTHNMNPSEESLNNAWNFLYTGVATSNRLIENLGTLNPDLAPPFINELRGLRALYYYCLLDLYGNVPLITKFSGAETNPPNANRTEVYNYIVSELTEIIPTLDESVSPLTYARVNANTARMILAKAYLNAEVYTGTARYAEASAVLDDIIDGGDYSLEANYFANFNTENIASKENIFVIPYDQVFAQGFNLGQMTLHYQNQITYASQDSPWNGYATMQEFYDSYEDGDLRKGESGNPAVRSNFLAGPQFAADGSTRLLDPAAEATDPDGQELTFTPEINELAPGALRQAGARIAKFEYEQGFTQNLNNDFPIFRYADALLMKAECLMRTNGDDDNDALDLVNLVRRRSLGDSLVADFDELNMDLLLAERGREMFAEGYRRQDLIRFDRWDDEWAFKPVSSDDKRLMPIPAPQLQANPSLIQNPGY